MKAIYKYPLVPMVMQKLSLPKDSEILSVKNQKGQINLWALIDTEQKVMQDCEIRIVGTGQTMLSREKFKFIDTVITNEGNSVWHVFVRVIL